MYLPSREIAASLLSPVHVSFSSLSGGATRVFPSTVLSLPEFFVDLFDNVQRTSPAPATTINNTTAIVIVRLLLLVEAAGEAGISPRFGPDLTVLLSFGLMAGSRLSGSSLFLSSPAASSDWASAVSNLLV